MIKVFFIGLFLSAFSLFAKQDTNNVITSKSVFNGSGNVEFIPFDTNLSQFKQYQLDGFKDFISLGQIGLGISNLTLKPIVYGFNLGESSFDANYERLKSLEIYKSLKPFARISYTSGPKKYQDFKVFFTQNVNARFNFSFAFRTFKSDGFYLNQETNGRLFNIQNSYETKNSKYGYLLKFTTNSGYANENGGIRGDSLYFALIKDNKLGVQVWMEEATNRYDKRKLEIHQYYYFNPKIDSSGNKGGSSIRLSNVGIVDDLWFEDNFTDSIYYSQFAVIVPDSFNTYDRSHLFGIRNRLMYQYDFRESNAVLNFGIHGDGYTVETINTDTNLFEVNLCAGISDFEFGLFSVSGIIHKGIYGFNEGGHQVSVTIDGEHLFNMFNASFTYENTKQLPEFKSMFYKAVNLEWNNDFAYVRQSNYNLYLTNESINLGISGKVRSFENYVYYSSNVKPIQYSGKFNRFEFGISKGFTIKSFHFDVSLTYQEVTDGAPVNIANWVWKASFYHQRYLFKDALEIRYGIDYWQTSSYNADYYAPFARSFTYQDQYFVGNYPFFNFYISARIKSAQGFVNFQNIGQLFLEDSYMMSPYYPLQDFGIAFGIRWDFYN